MSHIDDLLYAPVYTDSDDDDIVLEAVIVPEFAPSAGWPITIISGGVTTRGWIAPDGSPIIGPT